MPTIELRHPRPSKINQQAVAFLEKTAMQQSQSKQFTIHDSTGSMGSAAYNEPHSAFSSDSSDTSSCEPEEKQKSLDGTSRRLDSAKLVQVSTSQTSPSRHTRDTRGVVRDDPWQKEARGSSPHAPSSSQSNHS